MAWLPRRAINDRQRGRLVSWQHACSAGASSRHGKLRQTSDKDCTPLPPSSPLALFDGSPLGQRPTW
ncbi:MAG: hypothetical protein F4X84_02985 [Synechococcus sp. SB0662_bin_45]|uniref:Uncharacterized protein n=1 Tax=Synechococcus sp. SB0676_bin_10 TaxID=2604869 RepID=A0A6B1FF35_9SYNE|nr:hypothetical protein [Cyanobacteria bacterium MAG IRC3_bin_20]MDE0647313.1 hypothetical protein [Cyanobacteria bacterium MAG IRC4_bin_6]MXW12585.1 hypothetical protein [Synechococcus sp. SB0668_bin_13]MYE21345.1 hypothetical protein [Synechococcus sp. SB0662_bin_45]MYG38862.1 hypothetical protein [Synechococcus sp. SB0676_bin_10]MYK07774.1 hypothetical protein [Synechococcus sp. SB0670_bin_20]